MNNKERLIDVDILRKLLKNKYYRNKKIVMCHGTFDLLHIGHINHFEESKKYGEILVVSVTTDKYVLKGNNRPKFNFKNRVNFLEKTLSNIEKRQWNIKNAIEWKKFQEGVV